MCHILHRFPGPVITPPAIHLASIACPHTCLLSPGTDSVPAGTRTYFNVLLALIYNISRSLAVIKVPFKTSQVSLAIFSSIHIYLL